MLQTVTFSAFVPRRPQKRPTAVPHARKPLRYLEADLTVPGCVTTIGFSHEITGVFIPTFMEYPLGTEVGLRFIFDSGIVKTATGIVEWTREFHPLISETEPGLGIHLLHSDPAVRSLLERHAAANPPLFFDNAQSENPLPIPGIAPALAPPNLSCSRIALPDTVPPTSDFDGLLTDIAAYLDRIRGSKNDSQSFNTQRNRPRNDSPSYDDQSSDIIYATALSDVGEPRQFHGGFSAEDPGAKLFVATERLRPVGRRTAVSVVLMGGRRLEGYGTVRWVRKYNPLTSSPIAPPGLGIDLDEITESTGPLDLDSLFSRGAVLLCEERCSA